MNQDSLLSGLWLSSSSDEGVRWGSSLVEVDMHKLYPLVGRYISMCSSSVNVRIMNTSCNVPRKT